LHVNAESCHVTKNSVCWLKLVTHQNPGAVSGHALSIS